MLEEQPAEDRVLVVQGIVDEPTWNAIQQGLRVSPTKNGRVLFVGFASVDVPLGARLGFLFRENHSGDPVITDAILTAVTQQWGKPFDKIPNGWRTICVIEFPLGVPKLLDLLPVVSEWSQSDQRVFLATTDIPVMDIRAISAAR